MENMRIKTFYIYNMCKYNTNISSALYLISVRNKCYFQKDTQLVFNEICTF